MITLRTVAMLFNTWALVMQCSMGHYVMASLGVTQVAGLAWIHYRSSIR